MAADIVKCLRRKMKLDDLKVLLHACFEDADLMKPLRENLLDPFVKQELEKRDKRIDQLEQQVKEQQQAINDLEQYSRRNILNIDGVPETEGGQPVKVAAEIAKLVGVKLSPADVDWAHRLGRPKKNAEKPRTILVKFVSYQKRDELWAARKNLKKAEVPRSSTFTAESVKKLYLAENLTQENKRVMYTARQLRRDGKIWAAWTDGCIMKIRVSDTSPTKIVKTIDDVHKIANGQPLPDRRAARETAAGTAAAAAADTSAGAAAEAAGWTPARRR